MNKPKRQHWVPRFYLSYFSNEKAGSSKNPQVFVLDKNQARAEPYSTSVKKVCGQRYMYSPKNEDGERDFGFEGFLGNIESEIAGLLLDGDLDHIEVMIERDRRKLSEFMAALVLRNKYILDSVERLMVLRNKLFGAPAETEFRRTIKSADEEIVEEVFDLHDPKRHFIQTNKYALPNLTDTIFELTWTLIVCDSNCFITSDRPVTSVHPRVRAPGPRTKGAKTIFPITPRSCLLMRKKSGVPAFTRVDADESTAQELNCLIRDFSVRFVFASHESHFQ